MKKRIPLTGVLPAGSGKVVSIVKHGSYYIIACENYLWKMLGETIVPLELTYVTEEEE